MDFNERVSSMIEPYKVSICVPIYGVERYIERCAISLFEQTYNNIEYIFVDDCSPDNSINVLQSVVDRYPSRKDKVHIIKHKGNKGLAIARNTAVENATGEYILHIDSDDYINKEYVRKMVRCIISDDVDFVNPTIYMIFTRYKKVRIYPNISNGRDYCLALTSRSCPVRIAGPMIKRLLYVNNNISAQEGLNVGEDYHVIPRLAYFAKEVKSCNDAIYYYDCTNLSSYTAGFNIKNTEQILLALNVLKSFFANKEDEFIQALSFAHAKIICRELINYSLANGRKCDFISLQKETKLINSAAIRTFSKFEQIVLRIRNRVLLRFYVITAIFINRTIKRLIHDN